MAQLTWNAEGGSNGVTVTTGNSGGSSGTAWDTVTIVASGTFVYDTGTVLAGSVSAKLATGGTSGTVLGQWLGALQAIWPSGMTTHTGRRALRVAALPSANRTIVQMTDTTGATNRMNILLLTTGAIRLRNAASGTVVTTSTTISVDTDYWIAWRADGSTTGAYQLDIGLIGSSTPIETIVGGTANFGGTIGASAFGYVSSAASLANQWLDSVLIQDSATVPGPEATGHTVAVGQVTETDTAQPVTARKTAAIGQTTETDTATALTGRKSVAAGQAAEVDTAHAVTARKSATIGQASEADTAQPIGRSKTAQVGQASEVDTATAVTGHKTRALGQAGETDTAQPVQRAAAGQLGQAVETDTALPITGRKTRTIGQATEVDAALAVTAGAAARNLVLTVGPPESKWLIGRPEPKWLIGAPE